MVAKASLPVAVLLALLIAGGAPSSAPQISPSVSPSLGMGFGPGSITPISQGVPVYAQGDQLWIESYANYTVSVEVQNANGTFVATSDLQPESAALVYTFTGADVGGTWQLWAASAGQNSLLLATEFTLVGSRSGGVSITGYNLTQGDLLAMNFTLSTAGAYDISACAVGITQPLSLVVPIPSGLGDGQLSLARDGGQVTANLTGTVTNPFTFWTELYQNYSYESGSNSTVVSRDLEVASTGAIDVAKNFTNSTTSLGSEANIRTGELTGWTFFESSQGISVAQTPLLVVNADDWFSLADCSTSANNLSPDYSISASLAKPVSSWPLQLYTMYEVEGVEELSNLTIPVQPAAITVMASPWNETFTNPGLTLIGPGENTSILSSVSDNVIYVLAQSYPVLLTIGLYGQATIDYTVQAPFSNSLLEVNSSQVVVGTAVNGASASGVEVTVEDAGGPVATTPSAGGSATFYLLPGNYTVTASSGNSTASSSVDALGGLRTSVDLDLTIVQPPTGGTLLTALLASTALIGFIASVWAWTSAYRGRTARRVAET